MAHDCESAWCGDEDEIVIRSLKGVVRTPAGLPLFSLQVGGTFNHRPTKQPRAHDSDVDSSLSADSDSLPLGPAQNAVSDAGSSRSSSSGPQTSQYRLSRFSRSILPFNYSYHPLWSEFESESESESVVGDRVESAEQLQPHEVPLDVPPTESLSGADSVIGTESVALPLREKQIVVRVVSMSGEYLDDVTFRPQEVARLSDLVERLERNNYAAILKKCPSVAYGARIGSTEYARIYREAFPKFGTTDYDESISNLRPPALRSPDQRKEWEGSLVLRFAGSDPDVEGDFPLIDDFSLPLEKLVTKSEEVEKSENREEVDIVELTFVISKEHTTWSDFVRAQANWDAFRKEHGIITMPKRTQTWDEEKKSVEVHNDSGGPGAQEVHLRASLEPYCVTATCRGLGWLQDRYDPSTLNKAHLAEQNDYEYFVEKAAWHEEDAMDQKTTNKGMEGDEWTAIDGEAALESVKRLWTNEFERGRASDFLRRRP